MQSRQLVPVLVDLHDGVGDVVHVLFARQQHVLADPHRLLAELVVVGIVQLVAVAVEPAPSGSCVVKFFEVRAASIRPSWYCGP